MVVGCAQEPFVFGFEFDPSIAGPTLVKAYRRPVSEKFDDPGCFTSCLQGQPTCPGRRKNVLSSTCVVAALPPSQIGRARRPVEEGLRLLNLKSRLLRATLTWPWTPDHPKNAEKTPERVFKTTPGPADDNEHRFSQGTGSKFRRLTVMSEGHMLQP